MEWSERAVVERRLIAADALAEAVWEFLEYPDGDRDALYCELSAYERAKNE